jgi:hypothetical protein
MTSLISVRSRGHEDSRRIPSRCMYQLGNYLGITSVQVQARRERKRGHPHLDGPLVVQLRSTPRRRRQLSQSTGCGSRQRNRLPWHRYTGTPRACLVIQYLALAVIMCNSCCRHGKPRSQRVCVVCSASGVDSSLQAQCLPVFLSDWRASSIADK